MKKINSKSSAKNAEKEPVKKSSKALFITLGAVVLIVGAFLGFMHLKRSELQKKIASTNKAGEAGKGVGSLEKQTFNQSFEYYAKGELKEAAKKLEDILKMNPKNYVANLYLSKFYKDLGELEESEKFIKKAWELNKGSSTVYNNYGMLLFEKGDYKNARKFLSKARKFSKRNNWKLNLNYALSLEKLSELRKASKVYEEILSQKKLSGSLKKIIEKRLKKLSPIVEASNKRRSEV